jgi:SAM-dependent methyltransferase
VDRRSRAQHRVWEQIAASFDARRTRTWPHVDAFLAAVADAAPHARVLDAMAGNGRHTRVGDRLGLRMVACDWSRPLARLAGGVAADARRLPFRDGAFAAAICVAGLHGIPDRSDRIRCLRELRRTVAPGGRLQLTVWSRDAPRFRAQGTPGEPLDVVIPWRADGHDAARTYHLYTRAALRADCDEAGWQVGPVQALAVAGDEADNLAVVLS